MWNRLTRPTIRKPKAARRSERVRPQCEPLEARALPTADFGFGFAVGSVGADYGEAVATDAAGNVYVAGYFTGTADFDSHPIAEASLTADGQFSGFVAKYWPGGALAWARRLGGGYTLLEDIAVDAAGNVYATGEFYGAADFDPGPGVFTLTGAADNSFDTFVTKLDAAGNFAWAGRLGGDSNQTGWSVAVDAAGNVYTTGELRGTADFDPGPGEFTLTSEGQNDVYVSKLDAAGNFAWAGRLGGIGPDAPGGVAVDASGDVYVSGSFQGTADFDPGLGTSYLISAGEVGSSRVDLQACKLEYSIVSPK